MRLQAKFTAVFAVAALTPIVGAALVVRLTIRRTYHEAAARILGDARRAGEAHFRSWAHRVEEAAQALADPDDRELRDLRVMLASGTFDEEKQQDLAHRAPEILR